MVFNYSIFNLMVSSFLKLMQSCCSDKFIFSFDIHRLAPNLLQIGFTFVSNLIQIWFTFAWDSLQICFRFTLNLIKSCFKFASEFVGVFFCKFAWIRFRKLFTPFRNCEKSLHFEPFDNLIRASLTIV